MRFNHINLVVTDPEASAQFYGRYLVPGGRREWLGESLHLRNDQGTDLAFHSGLPAACPGAHHGFLASSSRQVDDLLARLRQASARITDDCVEEGFRSIKFLDPDGYEVEVYWEASWP